MRRFVTLMAIVTLLFLTIVMAGAQVQKPTQPLHKAIPKVIPKVEQPAVKPTVLQWTTPSKPYFGVMDSVPSGIVKITTFDIELQPGKSFDFNIPLHKGGTMVGVRVIPERIEGQKPGQKKVSVPLSRGGSNIDQAIQPLLQEQLRERQIKVLTMSLMIGNQTLQPVEELSSKYKFLFIVESKFSGYGTGKGVIKNISNHLFRGKIYASSTDYSGKKNFEMQKQQAAIQSAIDSARNPDMLWVLTQLLKRHLRGYPGGKSDYENRFFNSLSQYKVPTETLRTISNSLTTYENRIAQRVTNKSILQLRDAQPIKMEMIRPILKMERAVTTPEFQVAPKPELKVAEPKVKPGELAAPQPKITVLYPNGGEIWEEGKTYTIRWSSENLQGNVQIQLWWSMTGPGGLHTISNVPNTGSYNFTVPKLSEQFEIAPYLIISSMDGRAIDGSDHPFTIRRAGAGEKYRVRLIGVQSTRCADDEGWEWGCDHEEIYTVWVAFGPGYDAVGRTEEASISKNGYWLYSTDINVFGGGNNRTVAIQVPYPLFFVYMTGDKDSGSPSREQILAAAASAASAVKAGIQEDWAGLVKEAATFVYDTIRIFQQALASGDDMAPPYVAFFDKPETLLSLTSGSGSPPIDAALINSVGNYDHYSIRMVEMYGDPINKRDLQFRLFYAITRAY